MLFPNFAALKPSHSRGALLSLEVPTPLRGTQTQSGSPQARLSLTGSSALGVYPGVYAAQMLHHLLMRYGRLVSTTPRYTYHLVVLWHSLLNTHGQHQTD